MTEAREVARFSPPRIAYHPAVQERFGVDQAGWRALIDAVWPAAKTADAVVLALSYCKARNLDPFKRPVHIVPVYSSEAGRMVKSVWPGIGELRTTAFRTGLYGGRDRTEFGEDREMDLGGTRVTFPAWAQVTVYRLGRDGQRLPFPGPQVYWLETYATAKRDTVAPNAMWKKRPRGQLDKAAEAAALRAAFPEELGNDYAAEEMEGQIIDHVEAAAAPPRPTRDQFIEPELEPKLYSIQDEAGEVHEFTDPEEASDKLLNLLTAAHSTRTRARLEAVWENGAAIIAALYENGRADLADEIGETYARMDAEFQKAEPKPLDVTGNTPDFDSGDPGSNPGGTASDRKEVVQHNSRPDWSGPDNATAPVSSAGAAYRKPAITITGQTDVVAEDMGYLHPEMARQAAKAAPPARSFAIEPHKPAGKPIDWEHTRADLCAAAYSIASPSDIALFRRDNRATMQALRKADAEAAEQVENALRDKEIEAGNKGTQE